MLSIGSQKSDRITTITDTTWSEYIALDLPTKRVSFRNGVISIVSPGRNHEMIGDYIRAIIWAYCRKNKIALYPYNQTTLKEEGKEGKEGKEADVAYCFDVDKDKPDLAVEVNLTSGSIDDLTKYQYLKIAEVWLWEDNKIKFYVYRPEQLGYLELIRSNCLSGLTANGVAEIVKECFGKSVLEVEKYFEWS